MDYKPTQEQLDAVSLFNKGQNLRINAFAGTGKTSTLMLIAKNTSKKGLYLAFNKSIQQEAEERFPNSVKCRTTHSLAYISTPVGLKSVEGKMTDNFNGNMIAEYLKLQPLRLTWQFWKDGLHPRSQGYLIAGTIKRYCHSDDSSILSKHIPSMDHLDLLPLNAMLIINDYIVKHSKKLWDLMIDANSPIPLGHDGYLKLWALNAPKIYCDYIMLDEAQDTNPAVLGVLKKQAAQIVYVGDRHQQIYEWRGAINAMDNIDTANVTYLRQSFRFGQEIAVAANQILKDLHESETITGNPSKKSYIGGCHPNTILTRTNALALKSVIDSLRGSKKPHIVGGTAELLRLLHDVQSLQSKEPGITPEFWGFQEWKDVVEYSQLHEGEHLRAFVSVVEEHGASELISTLNKTCADEGQSNIIISTAHKAKGREWDHVELTDDFLRTKMPKNNKDKQLPLEDAEKRLFYVALTRAKVAVNLSDRCRENYGIKQNRMVLTNKYNYHPPLQDSKPNTKWEKPPLYFPRNSYEDLKIKGKKTIPNT